jgi:O-antigen/teichoic acid export membrane protein
MAYGTIVEGLTQPGLNLLFVVVTLYLLHWGLVGAVQSVAVSYLLALIVALWLVYSLFKSLLRSPEKMRSYIGELLAFSLPTSIAGAFVNLINRVDRLVIGAFMAAGEVGIYQAASQTSALFDLVPNIFNNVIAARVSEFHSSGELNRLEELYKLGAKWSFYLSMPMFLVVCAAPRGVMDILYGSHYQSGAWPLLILCLGLMSDAIVGAASPILIYSGHQKLVGSISTSALIIAIVLNYLLVPRFGLTGGAVSTALAEAGMLGGLLLAVKGRVGLWPYDRRWLKGIGAAVCAAAGLGLFRVFIGPVAQVSLLPNVVIAGALFWGVLLLLGLDPEDKKLLLNKGSRRGSKIYTGRRVA